MSFSSGTVSFRRYRIIGWKHKSADDALLEALAGHAFGRSTNTAEENLELGWITARHLFDTAFAVEKIAVGRFLHFQLRIDRTAPPRAILRAYFEIEHEAAREASGNERVSKHELRQAERAAKQRADQEARSGAFRRISAFPLLIDPEQRVLYFGHTGTAAAEHLAGLFEQTFKARLEPLGVHELAGRWAESAGRRRDLEDAQPATLVPAPPTEGADDAGFDPSEGSFLGREFLIWLWYHSETAAGQMPLGEGQEAAVMVSKVLHLGCPFHQTGSLSVRHEGPGTCPESRAALGTGKLPTRYGLTVEHQGCTWSFVLDAASFAVCGLTLPAASEAEPAARLEERCGQIADLGALLGRALTEFLQLRLSPQWAAEWRRIARWAPAASTEQRTKRPQLATA